MGRFSKCCFAAAFALLSFGGIGLGIGMAGAAAADGIARQPGEADTILDFMLNYVLIPEFVLAFLLTGMSLLILYKNKRYKDCD